MQWRRRSVPLSVVARRSCSAATAPQPAWHDCAGFLLRVELDERVRDNGVLGREAVSLAAGGYHGDLVFELGPDACFGMLRRRAGSLGRQRLGLVKLLLLLLLLLWRLELLLLVLLLLLLWRRLALRTELWRCLLLLLLLGVMLA